MLEKIRNRAFELKKNQEINGENLEKINNIIVFLADDQCFFKININAAIPLLLYLGIPENEVKNVYFELLKPQNFVSKVKVRPFIDAENILQK